MSKPCGYYTQEKCYEEASKYNTKKDFRAAVSGAYYAAQRHGWLKDYTWFVRPNMTQKWTYDACYEEAKKYTTIQEFREQNASVYSIVCAKGWLKDYIWLKREKENNIYTFDFFIETIKKYKTVKEFRENEPLLYSKAKKEKWIKTDYFKTLVREIKPYGYWTKEKCKESALKYETISNFRKNESSAYSSAYRHGWLKEITSHMKTNIPDENRYRHKHVIYVYKDEVNHYVYVGLTNSIKIRHKTHCDKDTNDVLYQHFSKYRIIIPEPEIVYKNLGDYIPIVTKDKNLQTFLFDNISMINKEKFQIVQYDI